MKTKSALLFMAWLPLAVFAQNNEGVIVYSQTINMHRNLPNEQMKQYVPEFQTFESELFFKPTATLYKPKKSDQPQEVQAGGSEWSGMRMMMSRRRDNTVVYRDLANSKHIEYTVFMDKEFLIEGADPANSSNWKISGKQKMIAGYPCMSATRSDSAMGRPREITAWFAPTIPVHSGPQAFGGLPGMILEMDTNQGQVVITAKSIEMKKLEDGLLVAPDKGKKVTREEYRKIVDERMKEMREQFRGGMPGGGGPGTRTVIISNGGNG
jgi:GLPGLI family protein